MAGIQKTINLCRKTVLNASKRFVTTSSKLIYSNPGNPVDVVRLVEETLDSPRADEVLVKMLAAPVNPADINTIQGLYAIRPPLPSIPGNEGVGRIQEVGENVKNLKVGDMVVPRENAWGTWRTHALCNASELLKVTSDIDVVSAATMSVNPCTAYRMLKDFVPLNEGDVVIQNGANSACGQSVIQFCKAWGFTTVNIVRSRKNLEPLIKQLKLLGADHIITDEEVRSTTLFKDGLKRPMLALNCVGGMNALDMLRHLDLKGIMVTYGGMSREPVTVPTSAFIFKDIAVKGFWMTRWTKENSGSAEQTVMMSEIASFIKAGKLKPPAHQLVPLKDYSWVIGNAAKISGKLNTKFIFDFQ